MSAERVLVAGNNVRNVVQSAFRAGYEVYALTKFVDADLELFAERVYHIEEDNPEWVGERVDSIAESINAKVVLTAGYEDLKVKSEVFGCEPGKLEDILNKNRFYRVLERNGLPFPEVKRREEVEVGEEYILKPVRGGGGEDIRMLDSTEGDYIVQRLIRGYPCSASVVVGREVTVIALNKIIAGWKEMNSSGFKYTGNITPLSARTDVRREVEKLAVEVCEIFDIQGSVGVDFIVEDGTESVYILEINPRFHGSLDSIEWSSDTLLFRFHALALERKKIEKPHFHRYAGRFIFFASDRFMVKKELTGNPFYADIPKRGYIYEKDDPIVSILSSSSSEEEVVRLAIRRKDLFLNLQA
jgi:hypothetical protein